MTADAVNPRGERVRLSGQPVTLPVSAVLQPESRRTSAGVRIGPVQVGGGAPIVVQSMTDTDTADIAATVAQTESLARAGSELVRITVNTMEAARAVPAIRERLDANGCRVPLIGDFHYNGHRLLAEVRECAVALAKFRINPGNVGFGTKRDTQFAMMIEQAMEHDRPVRIGVNWGSLDQALLARLMDENAVSASPRDSAAVMRDALVRSALDSALVAERMGLPRERIILSCKVSAVQDLIAVYVDLAGRSDHALHLGLTEAGMGSKGIVASTAAMGILLQQGIGDTIRVSLTPEPGGDRTREVVVAQEILQTMGLRSFTPLVTACPGCGRTTSSFFRELANSIPEPPARADAGVAGAVRRCRGDVGGGDGVRGQRPGREPAREHRHQPPRHRRGAGRSRVRGRAQDSHPARRQHRGGVPPHCRRLRREFVHAPARHERRLSRVLRRTLR